MISAVIAMSLIDRLGRKTLLLIGTFGVTLTLAGIAVLFYQQAHSRALLWLLLGYIFFFSFSLGSVIWVYLSEIFPTQVRSKGQSLGSSTHWIFNAAISYLFPIFTNRHRHTRSSSLQA